MRKSANNSSGFVLMEVLVSAVILSVGCLVLAETLQGSLRASRRMQDSYEASLGAGNLLWMLDRSGDKGVLPQDVLIPGSLQGLQASLSRGAPSSTESPEQLLLQTVTLTWQGGSWGTGAFSLSGYYPNDKNR